MQLHAVIPSFNAPAPRLCRAVASALEVPGVVRVWIVDDGSVSPVREADLPMDDRLTLVRQDNAGPSAARNRGLELAEGADAVIFLDDDDELLPAGVQALIELAGRLDAAALVGARLEVRDADESGSHQAGATGARLREVPAEWADRALASPGDVFAPLVIFSGSGLLVTRRAIEAQVRFDPAIVIGEDRDFLRRCGEVGAIGIGAQPVVRARLHPPGSSNLTSAVHFERRVQDHLLLMDRHHDAGCDHHWQAATIWLVNQLAKGRGRAVDAAPLLSACKDHGWALPLKTRLRLRMRSMQRAGR